MESTHIRIAMVSSNLLKVLYEDQCKKMDMYFIRHWRHWGGIAVIIIVYTFMIRETGRQILYVKIIASRRCGRNRVCYVIMDGTGMMDMKDA
jgi:hypothetical protein